MATTGALMAGLAFTATLFTAGPAPAQDEARSLVLHVDNYARLLQMCWRRPNVRRLASTRPPAFTSCGFIGMMRPERDAGGKHLRVLLLGAEMTYRKTGLERIGPDVLGDGGQRNRPRLRVHTQRVIERALTNGRDAAQLIGRVMAHEIGHLLLHQGGHSDSGIMRANLSLSAVT